MYDPRVTHKSHAEPTGRPASFMPLTPLIYQPNYCESCSASTLCRGNHRLTPERTDLLKSCPPPLSSPRPAPLSVSLHSSLTDLIKIYPVGSLAFITTTGLMKQRIRQNQSCSVPINVHYIATNTQSSLHPLAPETRWACWECLRLTQHPDAPKRDAQKLWSEIQPLYLLILALSLLCLMLLMFNSAFHLFSLPFKK